MLRIAIGLVLFAHGIGHSLGLLQVLGVSAIQPAWRGDSWLFGMDGTGAAILAAVLWTAAIVGFVVLAGIVVGWLPDGWWVPLAIGSALVSLAGLALFPAAFPTTSLVGAVIVDVALVAAVLWLRWSPADLAT